MFTKSMRPRTVVIALTVALCVVVLSIGLYFGLRSDSNASDPTPPPLPPPLPPSPSPLGVYWDAAVTTNGNPCAKIGRDMLMRNGSAVDATIAALFCEGVVCLQSMGLGGGFLMTIYHRANKTATTLNARETAPAGAHEDMYSGNSTQSQYGGRAVAVPGELRGYWEAFSRYGSGNLKWRELIEPSIKLCEEGMVVSPYLENILRNNEKAIRASDSIKTILINPATDSLLKTGDRLKRPQLAKTLRTIAESDGVEIFYNGTLGQQFVDDVQKFGGIITMDDLQNYSVKWDEPITAVLKDNITLYTMPAPGSGVLLAFILNVLNTYVPTSDDAITYQRIAEAFKYGYGKRTELGDPDFVDISELLKNLTSMSYANSIRHDIDDHKTWSDPSHYGSVLYQPEDHGTAHISVLAPNGDAVSVTSTINLILGAMVRSEQTGIILNNEMDDFSAPNITNAYLIPPSPNNFIKPGKRPLSSMCPAIFVDSNDNVRLVVGAAGGTKITTATALTALYNLYFNMTIKEAVDARRIHHQLFPMLLQYEEGFYKEIVEKLEDVGHEMEEFPIGGSSVTGIARQGNMIYANSDFRRGGITAGF